MGGKSMKLRYSWLWIVIGGITLVFLPTCGAAAPLQAVIVGGDCHTLALKKDGSLWAWGYNWYGQLGLGPDDTADRHLPVKVGTGFVAVAAGANHSLGIKVDGTLWAWGSNQSGQLGLGDHDDDPHPVPVQLGTATDWVAVAGGLDHSLALKADGSLRSWGRNDYGQLGLGSADYNPHPTPTQIGTDTNWVAMAAGSHHSLGLRANGSLWTWGANFYGELGLGSADYDPHPNPALADTGYKAVSAGGFFGLGIKDDNSLQAWGHNNYGQLGLGDTDDEHTPTQVGTGYVAAAAGGSFGMGIKDDNSLWAWGRNSYGQLGLGDTSTYELSPLPVPGFKFSSAALPFLPLLLED
jgi:alpha-tubulin suppressor-like RCC1 family protein